MFRFALAGSQRQRAAFRQRSIGAVEMLGLQAAPHAALEARPGRQQAGQRQDEGCPQVAPGATAVRGELGLDRVCHATLVAGSNGRACPELGNVGKRAVRGRPAFRALEHVPFRWNHLHRKPMRKNKKIERPI
jgi:hypothetical protein